MSTVQTLSRAAVTGVTTSLSAPVSAALGLGRVVLDVAESVTKNRSTSTALEPLGEYAQLIQMQLSVQKEMQAVTMVSNVEKSRHESKMSAVRNVRVG
jgi:hypothetical protein